MQTVKPGKRLFSAFLALTMACALFCPAATAAPSSQVIGLREMYTLVGGAQEMQAHSAMEYAEEAYSAAPVVVDLDNDGSLEVISAAYTLTVADAATGAVEWQVNSGRDRNTPYSLYTNGSNAAGQVFCNFIVKDLDGDGWKEIVIGYRDGTVSVLDSWGYFKPGWPQKGSSDSVRSLAVDDVDGDGKQEIIVGVGVEGPRSLWVYGCDGSVKPGWPQRTGSVNGVAAEYSDGIYSNGITTGDLDGDGLPEIIMPTDNWFINAYNGDGSLVMAGSAFQKTQQDSFSGDSVPWCAVGMYEDYGEELARKNGGWGMGLAYESLSEKGRAGLYGPSLGMSVARYADVDGDGKGEVVTSVLMLDRTKYFQVSEGVRDWATADCSKYMSVCILNQDRTRFNNGTYDWTSFPTNLTADLGAPLCLDNNSLSGGVESVPVVADLNGDGVNEILFNSFDGKLHCFSLDGKEHNGWPYTLPQNNGAIFEFATEPVCADLNGDGQLEVVFASWTRDRAGSDKTGADGAIYILDCNGNFITKHKLHESIFEYNGSKTDNAVYAAPTVADIDGDGRYEILVNTRHYGLCAYKAVPGETTVEPALSYANDMQVSVNGGTPFAVHTYQLRDANGGATNYVKIRDLAQVLYSYAWDLRFNITWSAESGTNLLPGKDYQSVGGEWVLSFVGNQPYTRNTAYTLNVNGRPVQVDAIILTDATGGAYTYVQLRELASVLGTFDVDWRGSDGTVLINGK